MLMRMTIDRDQHADGAVLLQTQVLRADVDRILERAGQLQNSGAGFQLDEGAMIESA